MIRILSEKEVCVTVVGVPEMVPLVVLAGAGYSGSGICGPFWEGESGGIWRGMSK